MGSDHNPQSDPSFIAPAVADAFATAKASIPPTHRLAPLQDEVVESREAGYGRLQEWAFCNGYALAIESSKPSVKGGPITRIVVHCVHHKETTRNSRNIKDEERRRVSRKTQANGCKFAMYISRRKRLDGLWAIGYTHPEHNHDPLSDPFQYDVHRTRKPGYTTALTLAASHLGTISYGKSKEILQKDGLHIDRKTFYNLKRREGEGGRGISARISTPLHATSTIKHLEEVDTSQIREWDAVEAIKRRLIASGSYSKERRIELIGLVWAWVRADSIQKMVECREKLFSELRDEERAYLVKEYQPKENQLIHAYTKKPADRTSHSAQQGDSSRIASKEKIPRGGRFVSRGISIEAKPEEISSPVEPIVSAHDYVFGSRKTAEPAHSHHEATPSNESRRKRLCTGISGSAEPLVGTRLAARARLAENTGPTDNTWPAARAGLADGTGPTDDIRPAARAGLAESTLLTENTGPAARAGLAESTGSTENTGPAGEVVDSIADGCSADSRPMSSDPTIASKKAAEVANLPYEARTLDGNHPTQKMTELADLGSVRSSGLLESHSSAERSLSASDIPEDSLVKLLANASDNAAELRTAMDSSPLHNSAIRPEENFTERERTRPTYLFRAVNSVRFESSAGPQEITSIVTAESTYLTADTGHAAAISHSQPPLNAEDQTLEDPTSSHDDIATSAGNSRKRKRLELVDSRPMYSSGAAEDEPMDSAGPAESAESAETAGSLASNGNAGNTGPAVPIETVTPARIILTPRSVSTTVRNALVAGFTALTSPFTKRRRPWEV